MAARILITTAATILASVAFAVGLTVAGVALVGLAMFAAVNQG